MTALVDLYIFALAENITALMDRSEGIYRKMATAEISQLASCLEGFLCHCNLGIDSESAKIPPLVGLIQASVIRDKFANICAFTELSHMVEMSFVLMICHSCFNMCSTVECRKLLHCSVYSCDHTNVKKMECIFICRASTCIEYLQRSIPPFRTPE